MRSRTIPKHDGWGTGAGEEWDSQSGFALASALDTLEPGNICYMPCQSSLGIFAFGATPEWKGTNLAGKAMSGRAIPIFRNSVLYFQRRRSVAGWTSASMWLPWWTYCEAVAWT